MEKRCIGCGSILQNSNENEVGYVVNLDMDYCKRCFQMIHYDIHKANDFKTNNQEVLEKLRSLSGQFVWIIDIFDLNSSLNSVLSEFFKERDCHIILNKCDLLPDKINYEKLAHYVLKQIRNLNVKCKAIITRGINNDFVETFNQYVNSDDNLIITGLANVGKSTIINELLDSNVLTTNRYPATTIEVNEINYGDGKIYDTVGIVSDKSVQLHLSSKQLKKVIPNKRIRPVVYQLYSDQTISIGGICKIDIKTSKKATVVLYLSSDILLHRCKYSNSKSLWNNNYGKLLNPILKDCKYPDNFKTHSFSHKGKKDYFISGLGFFTVTADKCDIDISIDERIMVIDREAMI